MVRRRHRCAAAAIVAASLRPAAALLAPPRLARTTARRVLADPPEEVETAIEALLQGAAVTTTDTAFEFVEQPPDVHEGELATAEATVEALLQGSTSDETIQVYESFEEIAEQDELKAIESVEEMPLPELEREILVEDDDLLREVDQDDTLWSLVEDLPVVADPILAAVAPDVAVEADEDAITRRKVRMRALPLFVVWLAAPTLSLSPAVNSPALAPGACPCCWSVEALQAGATTADAKAVRKALVNENVLPPLLRCLRPTMPAAAVEPAAAAIAVLTRHESECCSALLSAPRRCSAC